MLRAIFVPKNPITFTFTAQIDDGKWKIPTEVRKVESRGVGYNAWGFLRREIKVRASEVMGSTSVIYN